MKALKVLGYIVAAIGLAVFIFWFGWLRAPAPQDVCDNLAEIVKKETGVELPGDDKAQCVRRMQPPEFGRIPYVERMKCMEDAESSAELEACE